MSAQGLAGPVTGQGGGGAALASALNLDMGLNSYFQGSKDEECYGTVRLQPLVYMDDTARASHSVNSMRAGNLKLAALMMEKQLDIHPTKSGYLLFGTEAFKAACRMEAKNSPIMLGKINMKEKESKKYLGDLLHSEGLSRSVEATIEAREAKLRGSIYELRALTEDFRMQSVGGCQSALDLYEACITPPCSATPGHGLRSTRRPSRCLTPFRTPLGRFCSPSLLPPKVLACGQLWG